jgi:hypothetical protein
MAPVPTLAVTDGISRIVPKPRQEQERSHVFSGGSGMQSRRRTVARRGERMNDECPLVEQNGHGES